MFSGKDGYDDIDDLLHGEKNGRVAIEKEINAK